MSRAGAGDAYIAVHGSSFGDYLAAWERRRPEVLEWHDELEMTYPCASSSSPAWRAIKPSFRSRRSPTRSPVPSRFKLFGVVTNRDLADDELVRWHRRRCGKSEEVHAVVKDDLAGGRLPSKLFGANAAWWGAMILALNLNTLMKRLVRGLGHQEDEGHPLLDH